MLLQNNFFFKMPVLSLDLCKKINAINLNFKYLFQDYTESMVFIKQVIAVLFFSLALVTTVILHFILPSREIPTDLSSGLGVQSSLLRTISHACHSALEKIHILILYVTYIPHTVKNHLTLSVCTEKDDYLQCFML